MSARLPFWTRGLLWRGQTRHSEQSRTSKCRRRCAPTNNFVVAGQVDPAGTNSTVLRQSQRNATSATRGASTRLAMENSDGMPTVSIDDIELPLADGMVLKGQRWSGSYQRRKPRGDGGNGPDGNTTRFRPPATKTRILALHGWLDNCRSFHYLAPKLIEKFRESATAEAELVAIDLPGHGWSSHRSIDGPVTTMAESAYYVAEIIDALGWGSNDCGTDAKVSLIGHSMGGAMASIYAGVFPEQISGVVSIDIYGPEPEKPGDTAQRIRSHISQRRSAWGPLGKPRVIYPSLEKAIERRQQAAKMLSGGGNQYLSEEAAKQIVTRSMEVVYEESDHDTENSSINNTNTNIRGYRFRHDARWLWPSLQYLTADQIQSILEQVECPVCIIAGEDGYPFAKDRIERTVAAMKPEVYEILPGSHHLHADPDTADAVVDTIFDFFGRADGKNSDINR